MDRLTDDQMQEAVASYLELASNNVTASACLAAQKEASKILKEPADSPQEDKALEDVHSEKKEERRKMAWDLMLMAAKSPRIDPSWLAAESWKVVDKFNDSEDL